MILDTNIAWKRGRFFIPARRFASVTNMALTGGAENKGITNGSPDTDGAPLAGDYGTTATECWGISIAAAGDEIAHYMPIGWNWDKTQHFDFKVWFSHQATAADAPIWKVHLLFRKAGSDALLPIMDNADEVLTFPAHTCSTTADVVEGTNWKRAVGATAGAKDLIGISVECDSLGSASADEIILIGLEVGFTVKATTTDNVRRLT